MEILTESIPKILESLPIPIVLAIVGTVAIRAFLRLATFSDLDIARQSSVWRSESINCIIVYLLLDSGLLLELGRRYPELLFELRELPISLELKMLLMMAWMLGPMVALFVASFLLPIRYWAFLLMHVLMRVLRAVFRLLGTRDQRDQETPPQLSSTEALTVWRERYQLAFGSLCAFILCLVLSVLSVKGPIIFFLVAAAVSINQVRISIWLERTHKLFRRWILPVVWLYYWATACVGWQYEWLGLLFITLPALLIAGLGLFVAAGVLLPLPEPDLYRGKYPERHIEDKPTLLQKIRKKIQERLDPYRYPKKREAGSIPTFDHDIQYWCAVIYQDVRYWLLTLLLCPVALLRYLLTLILCSRESKRTKKARETLSQVIERRQVPKQYVEQHRALTEYIDQRRTAFRCLLTYTLRTNYPYYAVIDEKITERIDEERTWLTGEEKLVKRVDGDVFGSFLCGPGIVLTSSDQAVVLHAGINFKGAKGPGVVFTGYADRPTQAIDLKGHLRAFPVEAWTKDGIAVRVVTFIPFQIGTGRKGPEPGKGFPYRPSDAFRAVRAQTMEHENPSQVPEDLKRLAWYDLTQLEAERILRKIISRYRFDQIYVPLGSSPDPEQNIRSQIVGELRQELDRVLPNWGIQRIGGGISNIMPVDQERVIGQQIETWRANWVRKIMLTQAAGQANRLRMVEEARAQAQIEVILNIGRRVERLRGAGVENIARGLIDVLGELAERAAIRHYLPRDARRVIADARRRIIGEEPEGQEEK